jgi:hypothetical protein
MGIVNRAGHWHLRYVVPKRYRAVEPRSQIWISLKTDSEKEAKRVAAEIERDLTSRLEARLLSGGKDAGQVEERYRAVVATANAMGLSYVQAGALLEGDPAELVRRLNLAASQDPEGRRAEVADAALGVVETPSLMLSGLAAKVIEVSAHENRHKNARQQDDWENNVKRSVRTLQTALGRDVPVMSIGQAEARLHRKKLQERVAAGEITALTASKDLTYASGALRRYYEHLALAEPPKPYAGVTITDKFAEESRKLEFSDEWIRSVLLTPGPLEALNAEARDALLVILETGCRQGEVLDLPAEDIPKRLAVGDPVRDSAGEPSHDGRSGPGRQIVREAGEKVLVGHSRAPWKCMKSKFLTRPRETRPCPSTMRQNGSYSGRANAAWSRPIFRPLRSGSVPSVAVRAVTARPRSSESPFLALVPERMTPVRAAWMSWPWVASFAMASWRAPVSRRTPVPVSLTSVVSTSTLRRAPEMEL